MLLALVSLDTIHDQAPFFITCESPSAGQRAGLLNRRAGTAGIRALHPRIPPVENLCSITGSPYHLVLVVMVLSSVLEEWMLGKTAVVSGRCSRASVNKVQQCPDSEAPSACLAPLKAT